MSATACEAPERAPSPSASGVVSAPGYELLERLGAGGMGVVHRARDPGTGRIVALKLLSEVSDVDVASRRFRREFRAAARLSHPHVARVYDYHPGTPPFYTMEYVPGLPLDRALAGRGELDREQRLAAVRALLAQILVALDAVHRAELVHRDLKPANVLVASLEPDDELPLAPPPGAGQAYEPLASGWRPLVKLVDFGLAWQGEQSGVITKAGAIVGTVDYVSPEQVLSAEIDSRADLYAVGVLLYELIAGRPPFEASDTVALLLKHAYEAPAPPSVFVRDVDPALEAIAMRLLAKDPADRFPSALDALAALAGGGAAERPRPSTAVAQLAPRPQGLFPPRLVGRDGELSALRAAVGEAADGRALPLLIVGEAGIGKSRLLEELARSARMRGFCVLTGIAHDEQSFAFAPLLPILDSLARQVGALPPDDGLIDAAATLAGLAPSWRSLLPPGRAPRAGGGGDDQRFRIFVAVGEVLRRLATPAGVALFLDDLQAADPASLELLAYLVRTLDGAGVPLLVAGAVREEEVEGGTSLSRWLDGLRRARGLVELRPQRLDEDEVVAMAASMLGAETIPLEVARWLLRESQGVPFVAGELLAAFVADRDIIAGGGGRLELRRKLSGEFAFPDELPPSIADLVKRRLGKLARDERKVAAVAALIGPEVPFDLLHAATALDEDDLLDRLQCLLQRRIVVESRDESDLFLFPSKVVRDVLIGELLDRRKRRVHERVATALSNRSQRRPEDCLLLADHWRRAARPERAFPYQVASVAFHQRRLDHASTLAAARAALDSLDGLAEPPSPATVLDLLQAAGESEALLCHYEAAAETFAQLRAAAEADGSPGHHASALLGLADLDLRRGDYDDAASRATRGLALARSGGERELEGRAHTALGRTAWHRGRADEALEEFRGALAVDRSRGDGTRVATGLNNIGYAHYARSEYAAAERHFGEGLEVARAGNNLLVVSRSLEGKASVALRRARYVAAEEALDEAREVTRRLGDRRGEAYCLVSLGNVHSYRAGWLEACRLYDEAESIFVDLGEMRGVAFCALNRANVRIGLGAFREALSELAMSLRLARKMGELAEVAFCLYALGQLWRELGQWDEARRHDVRAVAMFREQGEEFGLGLALAGGAATAFARGDREVSQAWSREAAELAEAIDMPEVAVRAALVRARLDGDPEQAAAAAAVADRVELWELSGLGSACEAELRAAAGDEVGAGRAREIAIDRLEGLAATLEGYRPSFLGRREIAPLFA